MRHVSKTSWRSKSAGSRPRPRNVGNRRYRASAHRYCPVRPLAPNITRNDSCVLCSDAEGQLRVPLVVGARSRSTAVSRRRSRLHLNPCVSFLHGRRVPPGMRRPCLPKPELAHSPPPRHRQRQQSWRRCSFRPGSPKELPPPDVCPPMYPATCFLLSPSVFDAKSVCAIGGLPDVKC